MHFFQWKFATMLSPQDIQILDTSWLIDVVVLQQTSNLSTGVWCINKRLIYQQASDLSTGVWFIKYDTTSDTLITNREPFNQ